MTIRDTASIRSSEVKSRRAACVVNFVGRHMKDTSINTEDYRSRGTTGVMSGMHAHSPVKDIKVISEHKIKAGLKNLRIYSFQITRFLWYFEYFFIEVMEEHVLKGCIRLLPVDR